MAGLVACDTLGQSLIKWLNGASEQEKALLCEALDCGPTVDDIMGALKDCKGAPLTGATSLATCQDLADALLNFPLNQGDNLPFDATDCSRPVTICGVTNILNGFEDTLNPAQQAVFNAWLKVYNGDEEARMTFLTALASKEDGNLIQVRDDGLYVGVVAPEDIRNLYVDAVNGDDSAAGTRAAPLKTLYEAFNRGPTGVGRDVHIFEGQDHIVDPNFPVVVRGGNVGIYPYGPVVDTLPPVPGDAVYAQAACRDLGTRILAAAPAHQDIGGQLYQVMLAMYGEQAKIITAGVNFRTNLADSSGLPLARNHAGFGGANGSGGWNIRWAVMDTAGATGTMFNADAEQSSQLVFEQGVEIVGVGQLITTSRYQTFTLNVNDYPGTRDQVVAHISPKPTVAVQPINQFVTNLDGNMWP